MKALIIANGTQPPLTIIRPLAEAANLIVCADGGANHALHMNIKPTVIIGDMDSILSSTRHYYSHIEQITDKDQNSTDLEKAITYCIGRGCESADVVGAVGTRLDHSTGTLGCFRKFRGRIRLRIFDTMAEITMVDGSATYQAVVGDKISLIPLGRCTGITTTNLKFALSHEALQLGIREGISNEATGEVVSITIEEGTLLVYRFHKGRLPS